MNSSSTPTPSFIRERMFHRETRCVPRKRRVLRDRTSVYHVMSRTARKTFLFEAEEKEMFRRMLRKQAAFAGIEVLSYCLMSNHFHLLIRVPERPLKEAGQHLLTDEEIVRRYVAYYGEKTIPMSTYSVAELKAALDRGGETAEEARRTVLARMGDLSAFMKELKQRFTLWFNRSHETVGTLWAECFKSVVVENSPSVLTRVAAYIDLNPVRAKIVSDPKDYRWSGYGAAMRGGDLAKQGLCGLYHAETSEYQATLRAYRLVLYDDGSAGIDPGAVERTMRQGGKVSVAEALRCRVDEFVESVVIGGEQFVASCRAQWNEKSGNGRKRWTGWARFKDRIV